MQAVVDILLVSAQCTMTPNNLRAGGDRMSTTCRGWGAVVATSLKTVLEAQTTRPTDMWQG